MFDLAASGWFLWALPPILNFFLGWTLCMYARPEIWAGWYQSNRSILGPSEGTILLIWFVVYGLQIPGMALLWQDSESNQAYWILAWVFGLILSVSNFFWMLSFYIKRDIYESTMLSLISWVCSIVVIIMGYLMQTQGYLPAALLTPQVVWHAFGFKVMCDLYTDYQFRSSRASSQNGNAYSRPQNDEEGFEMNGEKVN